MIDGPLPIYRQRRRDGLIKPDMAQELAAEKLQSLGAEVVNTKADDTCHIDRKLITGASPLASDALGRLAATTLLEQLG